MKFKLSLVLLLSYASVAFSQPINGYYKNYDTSRFISRSQLRTTATEICNNNIDDDNNGLVDDKDFACYFNGFSSTNCKPSTIVWSVSANRDLYWVDLSNGTEHIVGTLPVQMVDVTWGSNGKLYGIYPLTPGIMEIDPNTANATPVGNFPSQILMGNSMTADAAGNIYADVTYSGQGRMIIRYNIASGQICIVADLQAYNLIPAGDLTFLNGILYLTCINNQIAKIDLRTNQITTQNFTGTTPADYFGLTSIADGYLYVARGKYIFRVDPVTMLVNNNPVITLSNVSLASYGLAAYSELCQAPVCLVKTSIDAGSNPPYCIDFGVQLKGTATPVCGEKITNISWTTADGLTVPGDKVKAITPGKYYLNIQTTAETCNRLDSFTLQYSTNAPLQLDTSYLLPVGCSCTGSMSVKAGCGSGNFKYEWSNGATTPTVNNICPGKYKVKVTDLSWGNTATVDFNMPQPANTIHKYDIQAIGDHCNSTQATIPLQLKTIPAVPCRTR
jgi:hypothetical protein